LGGSLKRQPRAAHRGLLPVHAEARDTQAREDRAEQQGNGGLGAAFLDALDVVPGEGGPQGQFGDGQAEGGADVVQGLGEGQGLADREPLGIISGFFGAPSGCGSRSSHTCLSQASVAGRWWSRSQVFCARTARSIMNQPVAGASDSDVGIRMLQDLLKELQMRAGTWQCEKLGARRAARGPHGRRAAGLLPGNPRNEREPQ
jgi:hypothetical protein